MPSPWRISITQPLLTRASFSLSFSARCCSHCSSTYCRNFRPFTRNLLPCSCSHVSIWAFSFFSSWEAAGGQGIKLGSHAAASDSLKFGRNFLPLVGFCVVQTSASLPWEGCPLCWWISPDRWPFSEKQERRTEVLHGSAVPEKSSGQTFHICLRCESGEKKCYGLQYWNFLTSTKWKLDILAKKKQLNKKNIIIFQTEHWQAR